MCVKKWKKMEVILNPADLLIYEMKRTRICVMIDRRWHVYFSQLFKPVLWNRSFEQNKRYKKSLTDM
ncbi:hypothetical protein SAMN05192574_110158 [Mucilaginibacter gossypiicola]|uniref:Uncharacterized protein n=1 Tax=Mucilaginibacter gossypiicola TaxID=551995 RepID=A0A1H8RI50_9SPHI|nr:hypothetical protein SAMN05192574_110158 [Mucilaginibacter gossypiicola]